MKHGETVQPSQITARLARSSYQSLADFLSEASLPALRTTKPDVFVTHRELHRFVANFQLPVDEISRTKPVVAIALPNGYVMAAVFIAVSTYYTAAPMNPTTGIEQFRADISQTRATLILTTAEDYERLRLDDCWLEEKGIKVFLVDWRSNNSISIVCTAGRPLLYSQKPEPNKPDDIALVLFTSGTLGLKKVVPWTIRSLIIGTGLIIDSCGLTSDDVCLNMMPLYHVGGLVRNILAPVFSRGCTVCCPAFDPNMFWDVVDDIGPTWYYASPSMHHLILSEVALRPSSLKNSKFRLVCNAAGALLPSLASSVRDTFQCVVLPSYGMTECLPVSTPPLDYQLDREGTCGVIAGPELAILSGSEEHVRPGTVGRICVRGEPVFPGYLQPDGCLDKSPFTESGWFDTGDLGYTDDDGYLYITGRSKEVINRGGEIISPYEVENTIMSAAMTTDSPISGRVTQALAFSVSHTVLQEVVAVVLVTPQHMPRVDVKTLHKALRSSLQPSHWPVLITYMDDLPKKNNKVLRINLGQRLALPELRDDTLYLERHWEARCPRAETPISDSIPSQRSVVDLNLVLKCLKWITPSDFRFHARKQRVDGAVEIFMAPADVDIQVPEPQLMADKLRQDLCNHLHDYMVPDQIYVMKRVFPTDGSGQVNDGKLTAILEQLAGASFKEFDGTEAEVTKVFSKILSRKPGDIPPDIDFLRLGGDSIRAGRLISELRAVFKVRVPIELIFSQGTVKAIAARIDSLVQDQSSSEEVEANHLKGCTKTYSSTKLCLLLIQLVPLAVIYPMRRAFTVTAFMVIFNFTRQLPTNVAALGRLLNIVAAMALAKMLTEMIAPLVGIVAKWIIIGRYREGLYPMWGWYHTRWWLVQKIVSICGEGVFTTSDAMLRVYHRLMGAKVGKKVIFDDTSVGEWDLLEIGDNTTLTRCICRPFAAEANTTMYLGRIIVGENCSMGVSSIIAPGSRLPDNTCIGVNSSSWELQDADEDYRELSPRRGAQPHWLVIVLFTTPIILISWLFCLTPWAAAVSGMVSGHSVHRRSITDALGWYASPRRIRFYYFAQVLRTTLTPIVRFAFTVVLKRALDAMFGIALPSSSRGAGARARALDVWRSHLMQMLMPVKRLQEVTTLFGLHYEATSTALRMLGAKVGKRVYWPGAGPEIQDYHLLDVGNDVVFGSRSNFLTSDGFGSEKIIIRDNAMIADRVCLLAGADIGAHTIMGSGASTRRGKIYPAWGTYLGSKGGDAVCLTAAGSNTKANSDGTLAEWLEPSNKHPFQPKIHRHGSDNSSSDSDSESDSLAESRSSVDSLLPSRSGYLYSTFDNGRSSSSKVNKVKNVKNMSPFGRAFYMKIAPYRLLGQGTIFCYSICMTCFTAVYWALPSVMSFQIVNAIVKYYVPLDVRMWLIILTIWLLNSLMNAILTTLLALLALAVLIAAKWLLMGRRAPGNYDWDKSSYCQRWQLLLCIKKLTVQCYSGQGILRLLTGTRWMVWYLHALGAKIGKDCAIYANGQPNCLITEADLISLGDRVVVDDASVVAHMNSRGTFDLNRLEIGDRCVLRTGSRLLSGATMEKDSCLLEHTLVMGGDVVEERRTMQGWPAERFRGHRVKLGESIR